MNPDEHDLITDAVEILKNYDAKDTVEDLILLIEHAKETIEDALHMHEEEGGRYHAKRNHFGND